MEQTPPPPSDPPPPTTTTTTTTTATTPPPPTTTPSPTSPSPEPPQPQPQPQPPPPQPQSQTPPTTSTSSPSQPPPPSNPKPPNLPPASQPSPPQPMNLPASQPLPPQPMNPMSRPQFNRPYSPYPHFSSSSSSITSIPPAQRGGMALGVPAPQPPTSSFSQLPPPSFGSQFGRPDSVPSTSTPQVRPSISGMPGVGMMGTLGPSSSLRPSGVAPQRPLQSSLRPQTSPNTQSAATQNFQDHGHLRHPSPASPAPNTPQNTQSHNQPWLSSGPQGKPPLAPASFRPQMNPQTLQQRSHMPMQQQTAMSASTQQPQTSSSLQPQASSLSQQRQDQHYTLPPSRVPQTLTHQQQMARNRGLGNQRPFAPAAGQPSPVTPSQPFNKPPPAVEPAEPCTRIISKRSIQEIVAQIDPAERLDPEVEDILVDIADDFVESVTTFACSLAKHRKSNTLEPKDILLHLEKNWNMSLPGFSGDEIKCYKKPFGNDVHRERLAAIKKSIAAAETPNSKSSGGQAAVGGAKGHPAKAPGLVIGSPNPKVRETT